jgi:hypothetical protein
MKQLILTGLFLSSAFTGMGEIVTFKWKGAVNQKKFVEIPAGKVGSVITASESLSFSIVLDSEQADWGSLSNVAIRGSKVVVAGPNRIVFTCASTSAQFVTLDVTDQITPVSGVTMTDR